MKSCHKSDRSPTCETQLRSPNCHANREPLFITKNGYGDLVVMSIEAYDDLIGTARTDAAIREAEKEFEADGVLLDARTALSSLRRKHFG